MNTLDIDNNHDEDVYDSHKLDHGSHVELESGINSRGKNFGRGLNTERYLPRKIIFTIRISNSDDTTQSHT